MKKFLLLLLPVILTISMIACGSSDGTTSSETSSKTENVNSVSSDSTAQSSSNDESKVTSSENSDNENISDPDETKDIEINVDVIGKSSLTSAGFSVDSNFSKKVTVTITAKKSILSALNESDIKAEIDVSDVIESGEVELMIEYNVPENVTLVQTSDSLAKINIKKVSAEIIPPVVDNVRIVNGVLISGTRAMEQFYGSASNGAKTAQRLENFKSAISDNVNVYVLPAPLASAFYAPKGYEISITRHQECFYGLRDALVNVKFVDTLQALSTHVNEDIYFRTDHHWQALAAYYCSEELAKVAGVPFDSLSTYKVQSSEGMLGSFYTTYTKDAVLANNPDTIVWYEPTKNHTVEYYSRDYYKNPVTDRTLFSTNNGYTKFLYGDSYTTHIISNNAGNGRKILIFKDSYGNALAPFLIGSFDEIYVADYRFFKLDVSDFIEQEGITDVCFSLAAFAVNSSSKIAITD